MANARTSVSYFGLARRSDINCLMTLAEAAYNRTKCFHQKRERHNNERAELLVNF